MNLGPRVRPPVLLFTLFAAAWCGQSVARAAAIAGDASITDSTTNGTLFTYDLTLKNLGTTGNDVIQTFWFAWIPGEDFMPTAPTNITSPPGWTESVINAGAGDGYSIEWHTTTGTAVSPSSSAVKPGNSLMGFSFESMTTPSQMSGLSPDHTIYQTTTTFIYSGQPETGDGAEFVATLVPEPSSLCLGGGGLLLLIRRRRSRA